MQKKKINYRGIELLAFSFLSCAISGFAAEETAPPNVNTTSPPKLTSIVPMPGKTKISFGALAGAAWGDPYLNQYNFGANVGFHFNDTYSVHLSGYKTFSPAADITSRLVSELGVIVSTNEPSFYIGSEGRVRLISGRLNVLGADDIRFETYASLGFGLLSAETGRYLGFTGGLGEQFFVADNLVLSLDARALRFYENIIGKASTNLGQSLGGRANLTFMVTVGFCMYIDMGSHVDQSSGKKL